MTVYDGKSTESPESQLDGKLWLRKWKILVTDAQDNEALNVSDLHCVFEVHKQRDKGGFYAVVRIYNLNASAEKKLVMEGDRLIIEAGYQGTASTSSQQEDGSVKTEEVDLQYGKIFDGKIVWPSRSRESNTDYVLTLMAIDGDAPLNLNFISKSINRGLNARRIVETAANEAEVKTPVGVVSDGLSEQVLPRGKVFFGRPYDYIQDVCRGNSASYYIEDGSLHVTRMQDVAKDDALVVSPKTGLIGTPQQLQFGMSFKVLLNPAIHLGSLIKLQDVQANEVTTQPGQQVTPLDDEWIYQVMGLTHTGDTRGNAWYTEIQGISRYGKGSLPALLGSVGQNGNGA